MRMAANFTTHEIKLVNNERIDIRDTDKVDFNDPLQVYIDWGEKKVRDNINWPTRTIIPRTAILTISVR